MQISYIRVLILGINTLLILSHVARDGRGLWKVSEN
jgi:hypothetical protein